MTSEPDFSDSSLFHKINGLLSEMILQNDSRLEELLVTVDLSLEEIKDLKLPEIPVNPENPCSVHSKDYFDLDRRRKMAFVKIFEYVEAHHLDLYKRIQEMQV